MSIDYLVDPYQRIITVTLDGIVNGTMLSELQQQLRNDLGIENGFNELIDFTLMEYFETVAISARTSLCRRPLLR